MAISIDYEDIYSEFLLSLEDWDLASLSEYEASEFLLGYLRSAASQPYITKIFNTLELDDDLETITFELRNPRSDDLDLGFVQTIFAKSMAVPWLDGQIKSHRNTLQVFGSSEEKYFSQREHLRGLRELRKTITDEIRKMIRDRDYVYNSYIGDDY